MQAKCSANVSTPTMCWMPFQVLGKQKGKRASPCFHEATFSWQEMDTPASGSSKCCKGDEAGRGLGVAEQQCRLEWPSPCHRAE